jgi:hypothetical protein
VRHHRLRRFFQRPRDLSKLLLRRRHRRIRSRKLASTLRAILRPRRVRKNLFSWTLSCGSHLRYPTAVEGIR